jgi:hypothetical protein
MSEQDWKARAEREAAAIIAECGAYKFEQTNLLALVAIGWLQGANYADHRALSAIEDAFDELRASL